MKSPIKLYYFARYLDLKNFPIIPQVITMLIRLVYGCFLPHTATLGKGTVLAYGGLGIIIGKSCKLGEKVEVGASVLIGGNGTEEGMPTIGDNVYIGAGSKLLGPIKIGDNVVIGANSVVLESLPSNSVCVGIPAKIIKKNIDINKFLYHR